MVTRDSTVTQQVCNVPCNIRVTLTVHLNQLTSLQLNLTELVLNIVENYKLPVQFSWVESGEENSLKGSCQFYKRSIDRGEGCCWDTLHHWPSSTQTFVADWHKFSTARCLSFSCKVSEPPYSWNSGTLQLKIWAMDFLASRTMQFLPTSPAFTVLFGWSCRNFTVIFGIRKLKSLGVQHCLHDAKDRGEIP